jgi:large subunit ribosomal protein L10
VEEELAAPAKVLKDYIKGKNKPEFKAALIDGDFYNEDQLDTLAAMKSKNEVIGDIVGLLLSPVSNVVSGLQAQGETLPVL